MSRVPGLLFSVRRWTSVLALLGVGAAYVDVAVIPLDTERVLPHQTVVVEGGRITALGAADRVAVPVGTRGDRRDEACQLVELYLPGGRHGQYAGTAGAAVRGGRNAHGAGA